MDLVPHSRCLTEDLSLRQKIKREALRLTGTLLWDTLLQDTLLCDAFLYKETC